MRKILAVFSKLKGPARHTLFALLFYSLLFMLFFSRALLFGFRLGLEDSVHYHQPYFYSKKVLWDAWLLGGFPMTADPQVMAWYPPALLFSQMSFGWNLFIISAYVLASWFAYGYVYTLTKSRPAALFAGIVYGMSGFMVAQLDHASIIHSAAWLPLTIWSLEMLARSSRRGFWFALGSFSIALTNLAGHSQIFVYSLMLASVYALVVGWRAKGGCLRYYLLAALMMLLGVGLSGFQLLPTLELAALSLRSKLSYGAFISFSLPLRQLPMMVFPALFGGVSRYGPKVYFGKWNLIELTGYVGLMPLMLAAVGLVSYRQRVLSIFWLCTALLAFLLAMGDATPLALITYRLPVLNLFRVQARYFFCLAFAMSVLSGFGVKAVLEQKVTRVLLLRTILVSVAVMIACLFALGFTEVNEYAVQQGLGPLSLLPWRNKAVGVPLFVFLISLAALVYWHRRPFSNLRIALILMAVLLELSSFGWFYVGDNLTSSEAFVPPAAAARYGETLRATNQRLIPAEGEIAPLSALPPNISKLWNVPSATIYSPLILSRVYRLLSLQTIGNLDSAWQKGGDQSLNLMAVRYVLTPRLKLVEESQGITWFTQPAEIELGTGCGAPHPLTAKVDVLSYNGATKLAVVSLLGCSTGLADNQEVTRILVTDTSGRTQTISLVAGRDSSEWAHDCADVLPQIKHGRAPLFRSFPVDRNGAQCEGHEYLSLLPLQAMDNIKSIEFQWTGASGTISIKRLSLLDERTGRSFPVAAAYGSISDERRWRHIEDIEERSVYENTQAMPRAWLVPEVLSVESEEALRIIKTSRLPDGRIFDPAHVALIEAPAAFKATGETVEGTAEVLSSSGNHIEVRTRADKDSFLVLSDVNYPGWQATVDGAQTELYQTDFVLRGVRVPAGNHLIRFEFKPASLLYGLLISALSLLAIAFILFKLREKHPA